MSTRAVTVHAVNNGVRCVRDDCVAIEEPLEIRLRTQADGERSLSITMRTPGSDGDLAVGFLFAEGIVASADDIDAIHVGQENEGSNEVVVELSPGVHVDWSRLERHSYTTSSCGVCGKTSLSALRVARAPHAASDSFKIEERIVHTLASSLREAQAAFDATGGLHAAGLFCARGKLESIREDVGRHNAVDKLIGGALLSRRVPLSQSILMVSGRASFELVQKAVTAHIPVMVAVGAPSNLAIDLASEYGMTLVGFARDGRFNIYSAPHRICPSDERAKPLRALP